MRKIIALASLAMMACASSANQSNEETGETAIAITIPGGETLNSVSYSITGPHTYSGTSNTTNSSSFIIGGITAGSNYTITLQGTTTDGQTTCNGTSSTFSVAKRQLTNVGVNMYCVLASVADAGALAVDANISTCAVAYPITSNYANPTPQGNVTFYGSGAAHPGTTLSFTWYLDGTPVTNPSISQYFSFGTYSETQAWLLVNVTGCGMHTISVSVSYTGMGSGCPYTTASWMTCDCNVCP